MIRNVVKEGMLVACRAIPICLQITLFLFISLAFYYALMIHPAAGASDPSGEAGLAAALIALLAGSMAFIQAASNYNFSRSFSKVANRVVLLGIALGICASGYLWVASEMKIHPVARELWGQLLAIGIMIVAGTLSIVALAPLVEMHFSRREKHGDFEESGHTEQLDRCDEQSVTKGDLKSLRVYLTRGLYVLGLGLVVILLAVVVNIWISVQN